jgi:hypothetical protein
MKRRRGTILAAGACVALGVGIWFAFSHEAEPRYKGRKLRDWCLQADAWPVLAVGQVSVDEAREAREAIRHIGPKALPWLISWLQSETLPWERWVKNLPPNRHTRKLQEYFRLTAMRRHAAGYTGLRALGPDAAPVLPELMQIILTRTNMYYPLDPISVVHAIGEPAWPQVIALLDSPNSQRRRAVLPAFDARSLLSPQLGNQAARALVRCAGDPDTIIAHWAVKELSVASRAESPCRDLALAALTNVLADPRDRVRIEALTSVMQFGPELDAAVPALKPLLDDPNAEIRDLATNVWSIVQPDGFANARKPAAEGN